MSRQQYILQPATGQTTQAWQQLLNLHAILSAQEAVFNVESRNDMMQLTARASVSEQLAARKTILAILQSYHITEETWLKFKGIFIRGNAREEKSLGGLSVISMDSKLSQGDMDVVRQVLQNLNMSISMPASPSLTARNPLGVHSVENPHFFPKRSLFGETAYDAHTFDSSTFTSMNTMMRIKSSENRVGKRRMTISTILCLMLIIAITLVLLLSSRDDDDHDSSSLMQFCAWLSAFMQQDWFTQFGDIVLIDPSQEEEILSAAALNAYSDENDLDNVSAIMQAGLKCNNFEIFQGSPRHFEVGVAPTLVFNASTGFQDMPFALDLEAHANGHSIVSLAFSATPDGQVENSSVFVPRAGWIGSTVLLVNFTVRTLGGALLSLVRNGSVTVRALSSTSTTSSTQIRPDINISSFLVSGITHVVGNVSMLPNLTVFPNMSIPSPERIVAMRIFSPPSDQMQLQFSNDSTLWNNIGANADIVENDGQGVIRVTNVSDDSGIYVLRIGAVIESCLSAFNCMRENTSLTVFNVIMEGMPVSTSSTTSTPAP